MSRRRKRGDKSTDQKWHAKHRMARRFGIHITDAQYADLVYQITSGKAWFIERQSNRVSKFWVFLEGKQIPVVYDKMRKTIVTVLLPEWVLPACSSDSS